MRADTSPPILTKPAGQAVVATAGSLSCHPIMAHRLDYLGPAGQSRQRVPPQRWALWLWLGPASVTTAQSGLAGDQQAWRQGGIHAGQPGQQLELTSHGHCTLLSLWLPLNAGARGRNDQATAAMAHPQPLRQDAVGLLVRALLDAATHGHGDVLAPLLELLLGHLSRGDTPRRPPRHLAEWQLQRVAQHVAQHLAEPVRLADMAAAAGLSAMHFAQRFRATTGLRPHHYLLQCRVEHAKALLCQPRQRLIDIALDSGFRTQAHFTRVFGALEGVPPTRWRRAMG